jgi:hypothetical protein
MVQRARRIGRTYPLCLTPYPSIAHDALGWARKHQCLGILYIKVGVGGVAGRGNLLGAGSQGAETTATWRTWSESCMDRAKTYLVRSKSYVDRTEPNVDRSKTYLIRSKTYVDRTEPNVNRSKTYLIRSKTYLVRTKSYVDRTEPNVDRSKTYLIQSKTYLVRTKSYVDRTEPNVDRSKTHLIRSKTYLVWSKSYVDRTESNMDRSKSYLVLARMFLNRTKPTEVWTATIAGQGRGGHPEKWVTGRPVRGNVLAAPGRTTCTGPFPTFGLWP